MAKGLRASTRKRNNAKLRANVFGPVHDARVERLSAKLQAIVDKPRPKSEKEMDLDKDNTGSTEEQTKQDNVDDMDVDYKISEGIHGQDRNQRNKRSGRVSKKVVKKRFRNSVVFPAVVAKQKRQAAAKKKR